MCPNLFIMCVIAREDILELTNLEEQIKKHKYFISPRIPT